MRALLLMAVVAGMVSIGQVQDVSALGLKVAPLEYKTTLKKDEVQQGFVDVSNPSSVAVNVSTSVQAFKQINNDGGLQFYDEGLVSTGIRPELKQFELGPRESLRLFFSVDGRTLPEGDVYAALFFSTEPSAEQPGVGQSVRVGTILSIINTTPGSRKAEVTGVRMPLIQLDDTAKGTYSIKNTGPETSGFYPEVKVSVWPGSSKTLDGSLVFGGRERTNDFSAVTGYGLHRVEVAYGDSTRSQWVLTLAPWMLILGLLVTIVVGVEIMLLRRRKKAAKSANRKSHSTS